MAVRRRTPFGNGGAAGDGDVMMSPGASSPWREGGAVMRDGGASAHAGGFIVARVGSLVQSGAHDDFLVHFVCSFGFHLLMEHAGAWLPDTPVRGGVRGGGSSARTPGSVAVRALAACHSCRAVREFALCGFCERAHCDDCLRVCERCAQVLCGVCSTVKCAGCCCGGARVFLAVAHRQCVAALQLRRTCGSGILSRLQHRREAGAGSAAGVQGWHLQPDRCA